MESAATCQLELGTRERLGGEDVATAGATGPSHRSILSSLYISYPVVKRNDVSGFHLSGSAGIWFRKSAAEGGLRLRHARPSIDPVWKSFSGLFLRLWPGKGNITALWLNCLRAPWWGEYRDSDAIVLAKVSKNFVLKTFCLVKRKLIHSHWLFYHFHRSEQICFHLISCIDPKH